MVGTGASGPILSGAVLRLLGEIAAIESPASFGQAALEAVGRVVPFDVGSYNEVDPEAQRATFFAMPPDIPEGADLEGFPSLLPQNPLVQYQHATGDLSAHRLSDFITQDELHELDLYKRVYAYAGVEYQVAIGLQLKKPLVVALALNRGDRDFSDDELRVLDVLRPHLTQAYRNAHVVAELEQIDGALAAVGKGVVLLGAAGIEGRPSSWALGVLKAHFGPAGPSGLPPEVQSWAELERRRLFEDGRPRINRPLVSVVDGRQLVVRFVPGSEMRSDVLVLDERAPEREVDELRRLGLSEREAEVLMLILRGKSTRQAATELGISPGTLSKHLQHIYAKLGVGSRTAAIAAASDAVFSFR